MLNNKSDSTENRNIVSESYIGRDDNSSQVNINILANDINSDLLSEKAIRSIDQIIKKTDRVVSEYFSCEISKNENTKTIFSTEKIFSSLGKIGIPVKVSIEIIENFSLKILEKKDEVEILSTNIIRKTIADSIYSVNENYYTLKEIENWGDKYVRRYGDPNQQLEIIFEGGETKKLSSSFLRDELLKEVFERIDANIKFTSDELSFSSAQKIHMGNEIKESLLSLNLYRIHHYSLLILAEELATQPPHPWFIKKNNKDYVLEYNYKKYLKHAQIIETFYINNKKGYGLQLHIEEYIYHACATILSYYNLHIGCGIHAPLYNLKIYTKKIINNELDLLFAYTDIKNLNNDIQKHGLTIDEFYKKVKNLNRNQSFRFQKNINKQEIEELWNNISFLHNFISQVIAKYVRRFQLKKIFERDVLDDTHFKDILLDLLEIFPFIISKPIRKGSRTFFVIHDIKEGFIGNNLKPKLLITSIDSNIKHNIKRLKKEIEGINNQLTNFIFIITKEEYRINLSELEAKDKNLIMVIVTINEVIRAILEYTEPLRGIEELILKKVC